eukprot:scaffold148_cov341-Pavlova_lutheri.AAC.41
MWRNGFVGTFNRAFAIGGSDVHTDRGGGREGNLLVWMLEPKRPPENAGFRSCLRAIPPCEGPVHDDAVRAKFSRGSTTHGIALVVPFRRHAHGDGIWMLDASPILDRIRFHVPRLLPVSSDPHVYPKAISRAMASHHTWCDHGPRPSLRDRLGFRRRAREGGSFPLLHRGHGGPLFVPGKLPFGDPDSTPLDPFGGKGGSQVQDPHPTPSIDTYPPPIDISSEIAIPFPENPIRSLPRVPEPASHIPRLAFPSIRSKGWISDARKGGAGLVLRKGEAFASDRRWTCAQTAPWRRPRGVRTRVRRCRRVEGHVVRAWEGVGDENGGGTERDPPSNEEETCPHAARRALPHGVERGAMHGRKTMGRESACTVRWETGRIRGEKDTWLTRTARNRTRSREASGRTKSNRARRTRQGKER